MLYHWDGTNLQRVGSRDQEAALGPEWFDSHAKAGEELNRRLGAIQSQRELSLYEDKPEVINAYFKRRYQNAEREGKWTVVREYHTHFPHVLGRFRWADRLAKNMPSEIPSPKEQPEPIAWLGTARAWGDMVLRAYDEQLIKASSPLNALKRAAEHYVQQKPGKPAKPFNPRAVWQNLENRADYQNPTKPGPR